MYEKTQDLVDVAGHVKNFEVKNGWQIFSSRGN